MKYCILIDPALPKPFFRLISEDSVVSHSVYSSSVTFWSDLNQLIQKTHITIKEISFFINFGPGSYTGLKQSKILAEVFNEVGSSVYVFQQYQILKTKMMDAKYYFSSAYKNQFFFAQLVNDEEVECKLMDTLDWQNWFRQNSEKTKQMISIDQKFSQENNCQSLDELYNNINWENLKKISNLYADQPITYYRAVSDDYHVSISR